jgi:hypothetical protein
VGAIFGGTGAAALIAGAVLGGAAQSASDNLSQINHDMAHFDPNLERNGKAYQTGEIAFLTIGGAAAIVAVGALIGARRYR